MSRTKEEKAQKKRKRDADATDDPAKKPKKLKKVDEGSDAALADTPEVTSPKVKKDREGKKVKKPTSQEDNYEVSSATVDEEQAGKKNKKKEKKAKKSKLDMASSPNELASESEIIQDMKVSDNLIEINDNDESISDAPVPADIHISKKEKKKSKKEKAKKKSKDAGILNGSNSSPAEELIKEQEPKMVVPAVVKGADVEAKKEKKKKKKKKKAEKEMDGYETRSKEVALDQDTSAVEGNGNIGAEVEDQDAGRDASDQAKKGRFIVFVGNLPYSATKEQIEEHFAKIKPTEIRLRTYKGNNKFMGTCFVEFGRFDRMETCLKKYHHSLFPDARNKKEGGRKINVELSAGGGGNSDVRKERIAVKNEKLHDERARDREKRAELEMKQGERKEKKESLKGGEKNEPKSEADTFGMNPARLAMMQRPAGPANRHRY